MSAKQLPLLPKSEAKGEYGPPIAPTGELTAASSLAAAISSFHDHMVRQGYALNTIQAFLSDIRLLAKFAGPNKPVGQIATEDLRAFLTYLLRYRGVPCNPKSYSRRLTTLKVFFAWLAKDGIIPFDPAAPLAYQRVVTPLPGILYDDQIEKLLATTRRLAEDTDNPDARPYLLVTLILHTGIKKSECMGIKLSHIDLTDPGGPVVYIRHANPKMRHKERKLSLPPDFPRFLAPYLQQYTPKESLFECTARNLEYVLRDAAEKAGIADGVSFEELRMTCAVRDYRSGMPPEAVRKKLGLSVITWQDLGDKIKRLASPAL